MGQPPQLMPFQPGAPASSSSAPGARTFVYGWIIVGLLWVVACLNYFDRLMLVSMRESVKASIAMTDVQFGLLTSVFLWVYGCFSPLGGYLADRFGSKWVIIGSLLMWSAMTWTTGRATTFESLLIARALMGISEAFYMPAGLALIAKWHRGTTRSLATGIHMSGLYAGAALGGLGGYIAEHYDWRHGFTWFGLFGIAFAIILMLFLREHDSNEVFDVIQRHKHGGVPSWSQAWRKLFGQPSFLLLILYFSLASLASWSIAAWLPTFLKEQFTLDEGSAGLWATGYIQAGAYLGVLVGGVLSDRLALRTPYGRLYLVAIGFCIGAPSIYLMAGTQQLALAATGMLIYGVVRGFSDANTMPILCQTVSKKYRATGYGFLNLFSTFTGGVMIYAGGIFRDKHLNLAVAFKASAVALIISGLALLFIRLDATRGRD